MLFGHRHFNIFRSFDLPEKVFAIVHDTVVIVFKLISGVFQTLFIKIRAVF